MPGSQTPLDPRPGADPATARAGADRAATAQVCDPFQFGARGDGVALDTQALQVAIDSCAAAGGGTVLLARGTFKSGTITLRSHITLHIEAGATLLGSRDDAHYPALHPPTDNTQLAQCRRALVYAENADDVRIEGGGTIDGNADFDPWRGMTRPEGERPMAIFTALSRNVWIEGIRVRNAATWAVVNLEVEHLVIRGIDVDSPLGPTHDGIDVVDGHDVLIEDCTVNAGDDAICLKSGSARGLHDVAVRRCTIVGAGVANGLKLGTATVGPMHDITFDDISISNAQAAAIAVESVDGAAVSNLGFRHITLADVGTPFFMVLGARGKRPIGSIRGVVFDDIGGGAMRRPWGSLLSGAPADAAGRHDLEDIRFRDIDIAFKGAGAMTGRYAYGSGHDDIERFPEYTGGYPDPKFVFATPASKSEVTDYLLPGWAFFVRHARGVVFDNCRVTVDGRDARLAIATRDAVVDGQCTPP